MTRTTNRSRARKNPKSRSLNAFSIAQSQITEKSLIPKHRLGQAPPSGKKRARRNEDEDSDGDEGPKSQRARRDDEGIDGGSDSDGGHWKVGVGSDDESDIDSDEAMGESDEERFADFTFRGSSSTGKAKWKGEGEGEGEGSAKDLGESEEEEDDESEEDGEDFINLSEMLDRATPSDDDQDDIKSPKNKLKPKKRAAPESESEEDEDQDEDDSMSSADDESLDGNDSDIDSFTHFSEEGDTPEDPIKLAALQSLITSLPSSTGPTTKRIRLDDPNEGKAPNEYNLSISSASQKLTIDDLMPSITDPKLKKALKVLTDTTPVGTKNFGVQGRLSAPLAKRQQDRIDRAAAYIKTNETLGRWVDTVKANREADHLYFPLANAPNGPIKAPNRLLSITAANSTPLTALEATISGILQDSNMVSEKRIKEFEDLKTNKLSIEEVQKRTAELRIARELLYREEVKAKRIKKIKSKAYHRIHKKERMQQEKAIEEALTLEKGDILDEEEIIEQERKRAEERMTLRHKQSKWASGMKESGRNVWDKEVHDGAIEMARRSEELKRRIQGKDVHDNDSESGESSSEFDEEGVDIRKKLLKDIEKAEAPLGVAPDGAGKKLGKRLMGMKFMQNAEASRKKDNDAALEELRNSLENRERMSCDEESEEEPKQAGGRMAFKPGKGDDKRAAPQTDRSEFEEENISDPREQEDDKDILFISKPSTDLAPLRNPFSAPKTTTGKAGGKHISFGARKDDDSGLEANPWLTQDSNSILVKPKKRALVPGKQESKAERAKKKLSKNKKATMKNSNPSNSEEVEIDTSVTLKLASRKLANLDGDYEGDEVDDKEINLIPTKEGGGGDRNQRELVKRAFAGDNVVMEFLKEKNQVIEDEGDKVIDQTLPGWGSWTGQGLNSKRYKGTPKKQFLKTIQGISQDKRKDAKLAKVIINEKRIKKNIKYNASNLPHPFETKQQYERSLRVPIGPEWATKATFQDSTTPRVMVKKGVVVEAISVPFN